MAKVVEDIEEHDEGQVEEEILPSTANLNFVIKLFAFQGLLEKAASVLPSKDIMPVLKNYLVDVSPNMLKVVATDLELSVIAYTEMATTTEPGVAVFPAKRLLELVREAPDGDLHVNVVNGAAHITVGRVEWTLKLMDGSDYPPIPNSDEVNFVEVDRGKFLGALNAVRFAAGKDTVRPSLMMIDIKDGKARASDGVRYQQIDLPNFPLEISIPVAAVDDLIKLLRTTDQTSLAVGETENHIVFQIGSDIFIANKLVAQFPDMDALILKPALGNDQPLNVDRQEFMSAIKRVRVTADPETAAIVLALEPNLMHVKSRDKYGNTAYETLDVRWDGESRSVSFNHQHLLEMLEMADVKGVVFYLGNDTKTKKTPLLMKDSESGLVGILNQLRAEWA